MSNVWKPIAGAERIAALDVVRGVALLGVLMINALSGFRLSLFETFFTFHTRLDWANRLTDVLAVGLLEFKAIALCVVCRAACAQPGLVAALPVWAVGVALPFIDLRPIATDAMF